MRMQRMSHTEIDKGAEHRIPMRCGRPPREHAGEVEQRILAAAQRVFLDQGFEGASIDEIASVARAGKPTIYARHPSKEALFVAVVLRDIAERLQFENIEAMGATLEERFTFFGEEILRRGLRAETVGLFRTVIAEARRFPTLATGVGEAARAQIADLVSRVFRSFAESERAFGSSDSLAGPLPDAARLFTDLIFLPMILRGLLGESLEALRAEIPDHVARRVAIFLSVCARQAESA
jgi:AcrR family transcriptional regulator